MITKLRPGGVIDLHADEGAYAARFNRYHVVLQSDPGNVFTVGSESAHMAPGELWWFNHRAPHTVRNDSLRDRIHFIVDAVPKAEVRTIGQFVFQRERAHDLWGEIVPLLHAHWREIAHYQDIPLDPDVLAYNALEDAGALRCYTVRNGKELAGYSIFMVRPNIHYSSSLQANQDVLFVAPEHRKSRAGLGLIKYADDQLQAEGVQVVYHHVKAAHDFSPLLERMGYELVDLIYGRKL